LKAKNTKTKKAKKHKDGESYVSKHSEAAKKDDGIWDDMAEIFTNNKDFQKQTNKDSAEIDSLLGNKKSKKHDKINILTEKDNINTDKPEDDSETKEETKPAKSTKKEDKPASKAKKETDDEEEKPAKKG
jgi:hypothetical protein